MEEDVDSKPNAGIDRSDTIEGIMNQRIEQVIETPKSAHDCLCMAVQDVPVMSRALKVMVAHFHGYVRASSNIVNSSNIFTTVTPPTFNTSLVFQIIPKLFEINKRLIPISI